MKLSCLAAALFAAGATLFAADPPATGSGRVLPTRVNAPAQQPPLPPGLSQPQPAAAPPPAPVAGATPITPQPTALPAPRPITAMPPGFLAFDAETKEVSLQPGEIDARYVFYFTNVSSEKVVITSAAASCGCTVPKLPPVPWTNAPGATGEIPVNMNVAGKSGVVFKTVTVNTDKGPKMLTVKANIPPPPALAAQPMDRMRNQELAKTDRQAVFKGDCARCHVEPARGKIGKELFEKACGICHEAEHRASMVPDLHALNHDHNADYWKTWIAQGKPNSLMPAFAVAQGGPLTDDQIASLVQYAVMAIPQPKRAGQGQ